MPPIDSDEPLNSRILGFATAISLVIAGMVGTGVFTSLGFQLSGMQSPFAILCLWGLGGIYAFCGALTYGELSAAMPRSGGEYQYISRIYNPCLGFLSGWVSITVGFAAPLAVASMALGQYMHRVSPVMDPVWTAVWVCVLVSLLHSFNLRLGGRIQIGFTLFKIILILVFLAVVFSHAPRHQDITILPDENALATLTSSTFAVSFIWVTYAYAGWNNAVYIAGNIRNPGQTIPTALLIGTLLVTVLYLLLNLSFLLAAPMEKLAGKLEVAHIAAETILGQQGGKTMSLLISLGLLSTISAMTLAGPKVSEVIGEDFTFFRKLSWKNKGGVPVPALLCQLGFVLVLLLTTTFESVVTFMGVTLILSTIMAVAGVMVLRVREPQLPRPYKIPLYPLPPLVFLFISFWVLGHAFQRNPIESLVGVGLLLIGIPLYFLTGRNSGKSTDKTGS